MNQQKAKGKMMSESTNEFDTNPVQGGRNSRLPERTLLPTAVDQIAEECARAICGYWDVGDLIVTSYSFKFRHALEDEVAERLKRTLESINASKV